MLSQIKFLGASVVSFSGNVGWNGQSSTLNITLVEDYRDGDSFYGTVSESMIGQPVRFEAEDFVFFGLLQSYNEDKSIQGAPIYRVVLTDPRQILANTTLITGGYSGHVKSLPVNQFGSTGVNNLINVYGDLNSVAFGTAAVNDSGMPWYLIYSRIQTGEPNNIISYNNSSIYGNAMTFRSNQYELDVSELAPGDPNDPNNGFVPYYYRVGGENAALLDIISRICEAGGHDFYVILDQVVTQFGESRYVIRVKTVNRQIQPDTGFIDAYIESKNTTDDRAKVVSQKGSGREYRLGYTSAFIVGGQRIDMREIYSDISNSEQLGNNPSVQNTVWSHWGEDVLGNTIVSEIITRFTTVTSDVPEPVNYHLVKLNAAEISDLIGSNIYDCTTDEMRAALFSPEMWWNYLSIHATDHPMYGQMGEPDLMSKRSAILQSVGLPALIAKDRIENGVALPTKLLKRHSRDELATIADRFSEDLENRKGRIYDFVRRAAEDYYGISFMVRLSGIQRYIDGSQGSGSPDDEASVKTNLEIAEAAFHPPTSPIGAVDGLPHQLQSIFRTDEGLLTPVAIFYNASSLNTSSLSLDDAVIHNNVLYMKCYVNPTMIFDDDSIGDSDARAVVNLASQVYEMEESTGVFTGAKRDMELFFKKNYDEIQTMFEQNGYDGELFGFVPEPRFPDVVLIPLKSNVTSYGPWYYFGANGPVYFEKDESLVPWNYGGDPFLNTVAESRIREMVTLQEISENGYVEVAGFPEVSLGEELFGAGSNCTGIDVSVGTDGVKTNYRFSSFTKKFGLFNAENERMLRETGFSISQHQKKIRNNHDKLRRLAMTNGVGKGRNYRYWLESFTKALNSKTPHSVMWGVAADDDGQTVPIVSSQPLMESLPKLNVGKDIYAKTGMISMDGLFRPFSTKIDHDSLPHYETPDTDISAGITQTDINPYRNGTDIQILVTGENDDFHSINDQADMDFDNARPMALRGPLTVVGWGYDVDGFPAPNVDDNDPEPSGWAGGDGPPVGKSELWKAGPVDLRWDRHRKVWAFPHVIYGTYKNIGGADYLVERTTGKEILIERYYNVSGTPDEGTRIHADFDIYQNKYVWEGLDC